MTLRKMYTLLRSHVLPDTRHISQSESEKLRAMPWSLTSNALNNIFVMWTFQGAVFLLFLSELGLPKGQIGVLLSLFPFCGLLALGFAPVAARLGRKRVFLVGYGLRKFVMGSLVLLPWILAHAGRAVGVAFLFGVIIVFAILRSLAETAYYPWVQEYIPNWIRGKYSAANAVLGMIASCFALLIAGHVIGAGADLPRYLTLFAAGSALGVISVGMMWLVPGGEPIRGAEVSGTHLANMRRALRDRNLVTYLGGMGAVMTGAVILTSFLPLYLKEQIGLAPGAVVWLAAAAMVGIGVSSLFCGWAADRVGSLPVLLPASAISLLIPLGWLLLPRQTPYAALWCAVLHFAYGAAVGAVGIGSHRLLFNGVIPPEKSTAYTAVYYAWLGITGGVAPLLAGGILSVCAGWQTKIGPFVADGYSLLFATAVVLLAFGSWLYSRVKPDSPHTTHAVLSRVVNRLIGR